MKIGIVQFPGSNCERETKQALLRNGFTPVDCFWHSSAAFVSSLDGFVIVGGFSYEDRVRSGLIAAKDPVMCLLTEEATRGKPILGICNGAQILVESGLVPGFADHRVAMSLTHNHRMQHGNLMGTGFYNDWVYIKTTAATPIRVPIAHAEGRFLVTPALYRALQQAGAQCYYYCDAKGDIVSEFPSNPNGSQHNLAAVSNFAGNVLAMMPHPERTPTGDIIFQDFFAKQLDFQQIATQKNNQSRYDISEGCELNGNKAENSIAKSECDKNTLHYWVALLIHDNEAISLETTLQQMGLAVSLKKRVHWHVSLPPDADKITLDALITTSDELFNRQKECLVAKPVGKLVYFVREREDEHALSKQNALCKRLHLPKLTLIREIVWQITCPPEHTHHVKTMLENQTVLANPLAHYEWLYEN